LSFSYERSDSAIITPPFDLIDIESKTDISSLSLKHPFIKTLEREFTAGLHLERKKTNTTLLDIPFSFTAHEDDHETTITTLSCSQEWIKKSFTYVVAAHSDLRLGQSWFDATVHDGEYADSNYISWQGQAQLFKRFWEKESLLIKAGFQWTDDPLLSAEKFSIGGSSSVRGYRENQITADKGLTLSVELRHPVGHLQLPILSKQENDGLLELCPFVDFGTGWNNKDLNSDPSSLSGIGLGLRWAVNKNINAGIYYGHQIIEVDRPNNYDLQDDGVHFSFDIKLF
jgi:hemolysin activation/secretion protein